MSSRNFCVFCGLFAMEEMDFFGVVGLRVACDLAISLNAVDDLSKK